MWQVYLSKMPSAFLGAKMPSAFLGAKMPSAFLENAKCPSWRGAPKIEDGKCASCRPGGSEGEDAVKRDLRAILFS